MAAHLRYSGRGKAVQAAALEKMVRAEPVLMEVLTLARQLALPDCWLVSGAIYNSVWNVLTGRPSLRGVKDIDLFYFDAKDLSYEAEDVVIRAAAPIFAHLPLPVEIRNQARVHLWYERRFGQPYAPLRTSREAIDRFASTTHSVGLQLDHRDRLLVYAPYGLDEMFSFRLTPNRAQDNRRTHEAKAARALTLWPELQVEAW
ncbi:MAG TPA: nucleotidyltransferase family protein [Devosiaceae bacterium]|jgi:hypothetical protein|nr:nucleotidyltransferase family protein [Devosiaceae bacterium]